MLNNIIWYLLGLFTIPFICFLLNFIEHIDTVLHCRKNHKHE